MERITQGMLERLVKRINEITDSPLEPWDKTGSKPPYKSNTGNYHLEYAYGGVTLSRMCPGGGGGVDNVFRCGYVPKRELFNLMQAYIEGLRIK